MSDFDYRSKKEKKWNFLSSPIILNVKVWFFFEHFRLPEVIKTPTKPSFQPLSMPSKKVWANILYGAAVIECPDFIIEKKLVNKNDNIVSNLKLRV